MANRPNKDLSVLQDRSPGRLARRTVPMVTNGQDRIAPAMPRGLHPLAKDAWKSYWSSPMAAAFDVTTDLPAVRRWAHCLSERERFSALVKKSPLIKGSMGQLRTNPLVDIIQKLTAEIDRSEDKFGMNPLSRMRLGIAYGQAHDLLSDLAEDTYDDVETVEIIDDTIIEAVAR